MAIKNPQLRLPENKLRSEERFFGFRQCSFHSHRSAVGEGVCPLLQLHHSSSGPPPRTMQSEGTLSDDSDSDLGILSPVSEAETEFSFSGFV